MKKAVWLTPDQQRQLKCQAYAVLYKTKWEPITESNPRRTITYFNNHLPQTTLPQYDLYFSFSRPSGYDQRKLKENRRFPQDVRENIFYQESLKVVPAMTSLNYGKRKHLEPLEAMYQRSDQIATFYRRNGVMPAIERQVSTNSHNIC